MAKGGIENAIRTKIKRRGMSYKTELSYVSWYKRYVLFHGLKHPSELGAEGVERFLDYLAGEKGVAVGTQK